MKKKTKEKTQEKMNVYVSGAPGSERAIRDKLNELEKDGKISYTMFNNFCITLKTINWDELADLMYQEGAMRPGEFSPENNNNL
jgi:ribosomal protein L19E